MSSATLTSQALRATRAIVDLDAVAGNVRALQSAVQPGVRLMAVVKADGYGHGAPWIAAAALDAGATMLGVATVGEGLTLRAHGLGAPIAVLGSIDPCEAEAACNGRLEVTVADARLLEAIQHAARQPAAPGRAGVHLKVDTGLRRYGALPAQVVALATRIAADPYLHFAGVFTHYASADEPDDSFTDEQGERFRRVVSAIADAGIELPPRHIANSAGILTGMNGDCEIARPGIALYGVPPSSDVALLPGMRPVLRIESRVSRLIPIEPGDTVGYNRTFRAERPTTGALIPLGYADGYRRALAGQAWVGIAGARARVLGRISMDQMVVETPASITVGVGEVAHVLGGDPDAAAPSIAEMAEMMGTNAYEVLVGIRQRIPRVFVRGGEVVAVRGAGSEIER